PSNIIRDFADAVFGESSEKGLKGAGQLLASYPRAIAAAIGRDDLYRAWLKSGAAQSTMTDQLFRRPQATVKELAGIKANIVKRVISAPKDLIEFANRVGEQSTRIARFSAG